MFKDFSKRLQRDVRKFVDNRQEKSIALGGEAAKSVQVVPIGIYCLIFYLFYYSFYFTAEVFRSFRLLNK